MKKFTWNGDKSDRKSVVQGKSVGQGVDLGGRRIIKKVKTTYLHPYELSSSDIKRDNSFE